MAKWYRSSDFKRIQKEWEKKLEQAGFKDAEKEIAGEKVLKQSADYAFRRKEHTQEYRDAKLEYFSLLSKNLHGATFEDDSDRFIMEKTADGWSIQEISRELKHRKWPKFNRDTIRYIRRRYETRWGIRHWNKEDQVSRKVPTLSLHSPQLVFPFLIETSYWQNGKRR